MPAVVGVACVLQGAWGSTPLCPPRGGGPSAGGVELRSCCLPIDAASALRPGYALEGEGGRRRGGVQVRCCQEVLPLSRRILRLRLLKGGKLGEYDSLSHSRTEVRASPAAETERQGLSVALTRLSCGVQRVRYTQWDRPSSSIRLSGPPGVVTCASSLRYELHSRLQSRQVTTEDCPKTLLRDSSVIAVPLANVRGRPRIPLVPPHEKRKRVSLVF